MSTSAYLSGQVLRWVFTDEPVDPRPEGWYVSIHYASPTPEGDQYEVVDSAYVRKPAQFEVEQLVASPLFVAKNTTDIVFDPASNPYDVTHVVVWRASGPTGGDPLAVLALDIGRSISAGGVFSIPAGQLVIGMQSP